MNSVQLLPRSRSLTVLTASLLQRSPSTYIPYSISHNSRFHNAISYKTYVVHKNVSSIFYCGWTAP